MRVGYQGHLVKRLNFGVGGCILHLAGALVRTRAENEIVLYVRDPVNWHREIERGSTGGNHVRWVVLPMSARWRARRILWEQWTLPRRAVADGLDLLHATGYVMPLGLQLPAVLTVYDLLAVQRPELCRPETRWHYRYLLPASLRRARRILVPSRAVRDSLCEQHQVCEKLVSIVAPGVDERFRRVPEPEVLDETRRRYRLPDRFILFAGNLEPKKNLPLLIAAFHEARRAGLEGELILAGGRGWGTKLARPRPADGVRWLGWVPAEELPLLYRLASEIAFPSLAEGFGLPVLEAMAAGTVVVTSRVPAVEDSDPEAVVLVEPRSVTDVAQGLLRARSDQGLRRRLVERGHRAVSDFTWDRSARQTWAVYHDAVNG